MNKFKVLGAVLVLAIITGTWSAYSLGFTSIQWAVSGMDNAIFFISALSVALFGLFSALTLDGLKK